MTDSKNIYGLESGHAKVVPSPEIAITSSTESPPENKSST